MPPDAADGLQVPVREEQLTECAAGDAGEALLVLRDTVFAIPFLS
jgi:hypothetical protein